MIMPPTPLRMPTCYLVDILVTAEVYAMAPEEAAATALRLFRADPVTGWKLDLAVFPGDDRGYPPVVNHTSTPAPVLTTDSDALDGPPETADYSTRLLGDEHVMPVDEFREDVKFHSLIDYDGYGNPVRNGFIDKSILIHPSRLTKIPRDATHIAWYNR
jgi:hypothetical protein